MAMIQVCDKCLAEGKLKEANCVVGYRPGISLCSDHHDLVPKDMPFEEFEKLYESLREAYLCRTYIAPR